MNRPPDKYVFIQTKLGYLIDSSFNNIIDSNNSLSEASSNELAETESPDFHSLVFKKHIVLVLFFCIYTVFFVFSTGLFLYYRNEYSIKVRSVSLSVSTVLGGFGMMLAYFIVEMELPLPCFINLWIFSICGVLWITCFTIRAYRLVIMTFYNAKVIEIAEEQHLFGEKKLSGTAQDTNVLQMLALCDKNLVADDTLWRIVMFVVAAMASWTLIVQFASDYYPFDFHRCEPNCGGIFEFFHLYLWTGLNVFVGFPVILYLLEKCGEDGFGIRRDTLISIVGALPLYVAYSIYLVIANVGAVAARNIKQSMFSPSYFILGAVILLHITSILLPLIRTLRERYRVPDKQRYGYSYSSFILTLQTPHLFKEFKSYLLADFCAEMAMFYEAYLHLYCEIQSRIDLLEHPRSVEQHEGSSTHRCKFRHNRRLTLIGDLFTGIEEFSMIRAAPSMHTETGLGESCLSCVNEHSINPLIRALKESAQECAQNNLFREFTPPGTPRRSCGKLFSERLPASSSSSNSTLVAIDEYIGSNAVDTSDVATPANSICLECSKTDVFQDLAPVYTRLYDMFIKPRAPFQLNLTASIVQSISDAMAAGSWSLSLYDSSLEHVLGLMYENTFVRFTRDKVKQSKLHHINASKQALAVQRVQKFTAQYGDSISSEFLLGIFESIPLHNPPDLL